jgi:hypothetical protein
VSDVDRAKAFHTEKAGFVADHDHQVNDEIQPLTPGPSSVAGAVAQALQDAAFLRKDSRDVHTGSSAYRSARPGDHPAGRADLRQRLALDR